MRKIRIGTSTPKSFKIGSQLIKLFEKTDFSHFFIILSASKKLNFEKIIEASYGDVHPITYENFVKENKIFYEIEFEISDEEYFEAVEWLWAQFQKPYSRRQLFWIFIKRTFGIKGGKTGTDAYICTELVARFLKRYTDIKINKTVDFLGLRELDSIIRWFKEDSESKQD